MERLEFAGLMLVVGGLLLLWIRIYQRRKLQTMSDFSGDDQPILILVVSLHCAVCPAQKKVVAQISEQYPSLHIVILDAETQAAQARKLYVMTVPSTLLLSPDGAAVKINNGYIAFAALQAQVHTLVTHKPLQSHHPQGRPFLRLMKFRIQK